MSSRLALALILGSLTLSACGDKTLVIESNAPWTGDVDGVGAVDGVGNDEISLDGGACWSLRKTTLAGTLRAYGRSENIFGLSADVEDLETTSAPYGEVSGCVN